MLYPNNLQSCILFDSRIGRFDEIVRTVKSVIDAKFGGAFNIPEAVPGSFYRLFGGRELMITIEYLEKPANVDVFRASLQSPLTGIMCADIRERLMRNQSHVLVNISHGVLGTVANDPSIAQMLDSIGMRKEGASLPEFTERLDVLALITRVICDNAPAQAVHWLQSDMLIPGEAFEKFAQMGVPSQLHIHAFLFGDNDRNAAQPKAGIRTFGARHFIGREIRIEPSILPWAANLEVIMAFLRVATVPNGYIIPHEDTFGPEDSSLSYRVLHHDAEDGDVPIYELIPLMHREFDFQTDDYVPKDRVIDDRMPPLSVMPPSDEEKMELANEWAEKRAMAEGIGGRFEVRARGTAPLPPPPAPKSFGRPVFGRKGLG